jgi:hypothetical protein
MVKRLVGADRKRNRVFHEAIAGSQAEPTEAPDESPSEEEDPPD